MQVKNMALCALFAALMAVCAWIAVPVGGVTFTLQTFALFLSLQLLGGRLGTAACFVYLVLGAAGLPVFAGFRGGLGALFDLTGGYILGFVAAALCYWAVTALLGTGRTANLIALTVSLGVCYGFGTGWIAFIHMDEWGEVPVGAILAGYVLPYLIPDGVKLALSVVLARRLRRFIP